MSGAPEKDPHGGVFKALAAGLLVLAIMLLLMLSGVAHAGEIASAAPLDLRAQEVNTGAAGATACGCALAGAPGACLTRDALARVRNASAIELPSCRVQLAAKGDELAAVRGALAASQAQAAALGAASLERQAAALLTEKAAALTRPAEKSWFEAHAFGLGVAVGVVGATALALGIVYAILPARAATGTSTPALRLAPIVRW